MSEQQHSSADRTTGIGPLLRGLIITFISMGMLLGAFLLSQLDTPGVSPPPTQVVVLHLSSTPSLPALPSPAPTMLVTETIASPTATATLSVSPTQPSPLMPSCPQPPGWIVYTVQQGDTLASLAWRASVATLALMQANCLNTSAIQPGQQLYLPPTFYVTATPRPYRCGPPLGWVVYTVQPGDTLYSLSRRVNVGIEAIRRANCLSGYAIYAGQALYLPSLPPMPTLGPTAAATATATASPTPTVGPTLTPTISTPTSPTPTATSTLSPTLTATATPILTATATATYTPTATATPTATETPGPTPTATATATPAPSDTPVPTEPPTATTTAVVTPTPTP